MYVCMYVYVCMFSCTYIFSSIILIIVNYLYYNQYGNLFILIIITIPYYSDGIYIVYLLHMTYIITIKMYILCRITTHDTSDIWCTFFYLYIIIISLLCCIDVCMGGSMCICVYLCVYTCMYKYAYVMHVYSYTVCIISYMY